jgi:hypothetical protein
MTRASSQKKTEGGIETMGSRRHKQLLDDKDTRGYWQLKENAPDHTLWQTHFVRGHGSVIRQTTK